MILTKKETKNDMIYKAIKLLLSVLFFVCLAKMPYGFYQIVPFFALAGFTLLAIEAYKKGSEIGRITFIMLALLFQPFLKIALGRLLWNVVDYTA
ncbi:DUF6804 family protein [Puia dinghuensis]|uniref:Uncharacterized protein n=1 Tax=Puia dinghuensis TaxID=1792502 RepID=A0A8J2UFH4_9BACT|nr:DUF6804 family protein [Puia dinghuensis]GGB08066.1 hypothetical protein GCM10011511_34510 [Puia dinghuensis]